MKQTTFCGKTSTVLNIEKIIHDFKVQDKELLTRSQRMFPNSIICCRNWDVKGCYGGSVPSNWDGSYVNI